MNTRTFPFVSVLLSAVTFFVSTFVAFKLSGVPWGTISISGLRNYGGVDMNHVQSGEWWRLITSQFLHVKQAHMIFNVLMLLLLGISIEPSLGSFRFVILWLLSGVVGVFASIYFSSYPSDVGTGASQAVMGIAAAVVVFFKRGNALATWSKITVLLAIGFTLLVDLFFVHFPKLGHAVSFLVGYILSMFIFPQPLRIQITNNGTVKC